ncbi:metallophosphoesterase [Flavobacterium sp. DG2-3]|uniref:metallophosphoesterase family protein n=1 Tax=Flavobacterium sp. DG2-3 TaxID=3068317 RepID=UPI00273E257B|nr:metallophosphoesterase [Flavobacterium sp. DG2-3]MDP5200697.1 metallophosphoesterase [Flavobacterium sp. DG2-3]
MIVTIFGDVHGNLVALEKFFKIEKMETDLFICHGDVVNYGPWSNECIELLQDLNCKVLKGNHEQFYIQGSYGGTNVIAKTFFQKCYENFDSKWIQTLKGYEEETIIQNFTITHTINNSYIFSDTNIDEISLDCDYIIGHSHQQFKRSIGDNFVFNTGSLGQNRQYINQSCYIKIDTVKQKIELKSFLHDIDKVINQMKKENYPEICLNYYLSKQKVIL